METISKIMASFGSKPTKKMMLAHKLLSVFGSLEVVFLKDVQSDICAGVGVDAGSRMEIEGVVAISDDRYQWWVYLNPAGVQECPDSETAITIQQLFDSTTVRHGLAERGCTEYVARVFPRVM